MAYGLPRIVIGAELHLQGHVRYTIALTQTQGQLPDNISRLAREHIPFKLHMRLKVQRLIGQAPQVEMMSAGHTLHTVYKLLDFIDIHFWRHRLHKDVGRFTYDPPRVPNDVDAHEDRNKRVEPIALPEEHSKPTGYDSERRESIPEEV